MAKQVLVAVAGFVMGTISFLGYGGIVVLMAIESACIPLPSEIIMPFSGYLIKEGRLDIGPLGHHGELIVAGLMGALGCLLGSLLAYYIGYVGGRPLVARYGRYVLMTQHDLDLADRWFDKYGDWAIFFSRLMPIVRTFISLPAGIARMRFWHFCAYTLVGSFPWCLGLAYLGWWFGKVWENEEIHKYFHGADTVILIACVLVAVWWVRSRLKGRIRVQEAAETADEADDVAPK